MSSEKEENGLLYTKKFILKTNNIDSSKKSYLSLLTAKQWLKILDNPKKDFAATVYLIEKYESPRAFWYGNSDDAINNYTWNIYREKEIKYWKHYLDSVSKK